MKLYSVFFCLVAVSGQYNYNFPKYQTVPKHLCQQWCYKYDHFGAIFLACCDYIERHGGCSKGCLFGYGANVWKLVCTNDGNCPIGYKCCTDACANNYKICQPIVYESICQTVAPDEGKPDVECTTAFVEPGLEEDPEVVTENTNIDDSEEEIDKSEEEISTEEPEEENSIENPDEEISIEEPEEETSTEEPEEEISIEIPEQEISIEEPEEETTRPTESTERTTDVETTTTIISTTTDLFAGSGSGDDDDSDNSGSGSGDSEEVLPPAADQPWKSNNDFYYT